MTQQPIPIPKPTPKWQTIHFTHFARHDWSQHADYRATYSDAYIEHWAAIYDANRLAARRVMFGSFLLHPEQILRAVAEVPGRPGRGARAEFAPLRPAQAAVQARLDAIRDAEDASIAALEQPRAGRHQLTPPALQGERLVQPMQPRQRLGARQQGGAA